MKNETAKQLDSLHRQLTDHIPRWWYDLSTTKVRPLARLCVRMKSVSTLLTRVNLTRASQMSTGIQVVKDQIRYLTRLFNERQLYFDPAVRMFDDMMPFARFMSRATLRGMLLADF